jgi:hypothetical protein
MQVATDIEIAQGWQPGKLKDNGRRSGPRMACAREWMATGTSLDTQKRFPCRFNDAYSSPNTHPTP